MEDRKKRGLVLTGGMTLRLKWWNDRETLNHNQTNSVIEMQKENCPALRTGSLDPASR